MKKRAFLPPLLRRMYRDNRAATAVEYGLILALIVLSMFAALQAMAGQTVGIWNNISTKVQNAR